MSGYPRWVLLLLVSLLLLHFNYWMWEDSSLFAGLPVNLLYHLILCLLASGIMFVIVRRIRPEK